MIMQFCLLFFYPRARPRLCAVGSPELDAPALPDGFLFFGLINFPLPVWRCSALCFKTLLNADFFFFLPCLVESHLAFIRYLFCFSHTAISLSAPQSISPTRCVMADTALESIPSLVTMTTTTFFFLCFFSPLSHSSVLVSLQTPFSPSLICAYGRGG